MLDNLKKYHILLGSRSPRRRELLQLLRIPFNTVIFEGLEESFPDDLPATEVPQYLSDQKANAYLRHLKSNELIITADTLVVSDKRIFGKPKDHAEAIGMLMQLSGKTHQVVTGVTVSSHSQRTSFTCITDVKFAEISRDEATYYVESFNPIDKAGAYGIQEWIGGIAVEKIDGSFYNVMGLPIHRLYQVLKLF